MIKYLKQLCLTLREFFNNKAELVPPHEPLIRYIYSNKHFNNSKARWQAFTPSRNHSNTTSVMRCNNWSNSVKKTEGLKIANISSPPRTLKASTELKTVDVNLLSLKVIISEPPINHANITEWKPHKEDWKEQAMELSKKSYNFIIY